MNRIYELTEVGLTGVPPTIVVAPHPKAAVEEEYGAVFFVEADDRLGQRVVTYASRLLDRDRLIYIEVREVEAAALDPAFRETAEGDKELFLCDELDAMLDELNEPDSLGG